MGPNFVFLKYPLPYCWITSAGQLPEPDKPQGCIISGDTLIPEVNAPLPVLLYLTDNCESQPPLSKSPLYEPQPPLYEPQPPMYEPAPTCTSRSRPSTQVAVISLHLISIHLYNFPQIMFSEAEMLQWDVTQYPPAATPQSSTSQV